MKKKILALIIIIYVASTSLVFATEEKIQDIITDTSKIILQTAQNPQISSISGDWAVLGLARSFVDVDFDYYQKYYNNVRDYLLQNDGIIDSKKYTEYSRVVLGLTSVGADPSNISGFNLIEKLVDFDKNIFQGINGATWAVIALESKNYGNLQETYQYIDYILEKQFDDGGFALSGNTSDVDITAMVLQALANYKSDEKVSLAIDKALNFLACVENIENSEAISQVLVAMTALDIDMNDVRFVKNQKTMFDNLLDFYIEGQGFKHYKSDEKTDYISTEQAFYALVSVYRQMKNENSLYNMTDVKQNIFEDVDFGLADKHEDVKKSEIINFDVEFFDISQSSSEQAIINLAKYGIITGKSENLFDPLNNMTRAEFATIVVRALGLELEITDKFKDVNEADWYAPFVSTAYKYEIVNGTHEDLFSPNEEITREQAMVMISRASKLCGISQEITNTKDILSGFFDYNEVSSWAINEVAICYFYDIADNFEININPKVYITRQEVAQMTYNLLKKSLLI